CCGCAPTGRPDGRPCCRGSGRGSSVHRHRSSSGRSWSGPITTSAATPAPSSCSPRRSCWVRCWSPRASGGSRGLPHGGARSRCVGSDAGMIRLLAAALLLGPVLVAEGIRWLSRDPSRRGPLDVHLLLRTAVFGTWIVLAMELVLMWFMLAGTRPWDSMTGLLFLIRLALLAALLATLTTARRRSPHRTLEPALLIVLW